MDATRLLIVIADDFGIGPETSRGILELAATGAVTGTVLLVNSPHAADAVSQWRRSGSALEVGWHPCLTLDGPTADPRRVPSLVGPDGRFWPLRQFVPRLLVGQIRPSEIEFEFNAQYDRFLALVGRAPAVVNSHQHVSLFPPVGRILRRVLSRCRPLPYMRRVREPWPLLVHIPGAVVKRFALSCLGRLESLGQDRQGFPGHDYLAGTTDPQWVKDPEFLGRWLESLPGKVVELTCHPGRLDDTLAGRDCPPGHPLIRRRVDELHLLRQPRFLEACRKAGFTRVPASHLSAATPRGLPHAA